VYVLDLVEETTEFVGVMRGHVGLRNAPRKKEIRLAASSGLPPSSHAFDLCVHPKQKRNAYNREQQDGDLWRHYDEKLLLQTPSRRVKCGAAAHTAVIEKPCRPSIRQVVLLLDRRGVPSF
jgi:hypothetical protein